MAKNSLPETPTKLTDIEIFKKSISPTLTVEIFKNKKKEFCFHVKARNKKIICQSEGYKTRQGAMKSIKLLMGMNVWNIVDLTK